MKKKDETRHFVTDVASVPVYKVASKTEMYRMATIRRRSVCGNAPTCWCCGLLTGKFIALRRNIGFFRQGCLLGAPCKHADGQQGGNDDG